MEIRSIELEGCDYFNTNFYKVISYICFMEILEKISSFLRGWNKRGVIDNGSHPYMDSEFQKRLYLTRIVESIDPQDLIDGYKRLKNNPNSYSHSAKAEKFIEAGRSMFTRWNGLYWESC